MKKKIPMISYSRQVRNYISIIVAFILVSCSVPETTTVVPTDTGIIEGAKTPPPTLTTAFPLHTVTPNILSILPDQNTTPVSSSTKTSAPITNTITFSVSVGFNVTATPYPTSELDFMPVPTSDQNWSSIRERIDELQGFYTLAISPDGKLLAAVESNDNFSKVYLWDIETGNLKWFVESDDFIATTKLIFSPDGTLLATGTDGVAQDVYVWNVADGNQLYKLLYQAYTTDMSFSFDNKLLAIGGVFPAKATVWNLEDTSVTELDMGNGVGFMPESPTALLAVAKGWRLQNEASPVYLQNWQNGQIDYFFPNSFYAEGIAFSLDGQLLATVIVNEEGQSNLRILNLQNNEEVTIEDHELGDTQIRQIDFSSRGHIAVLQGNLILWNTNGKLLGSLNSPDIKGFIFTPDGSFLLTYGNFGTPLEIWELPTS